MGQFGLFEDDKMSALVGAIWFAWQRHDGQLDKCGQPFIGHPLRVMARLVPNPVLMAVGVLHDVVEDTDTTLDEIRLRFGDRIADGVDSMTRRKSQGEKWSAYIDRVLLNEDAIRVKLADMADNSDPTRVGSGTVDGQPMSEWHAAMVRERYAPATERLSRALAVHT